MHFGEIHFVIASHTAWAPSLDTDAARLVRTHGRTDAAAASEPRLANMPAMLRRRASATGRMALQAAYDCLAEQTTNIPIIFASRHGECERAVSLLQELVTQVPLSPTTFNLSVHNANAGLLSIARGDRSNSVAVAAGPSTIEHALIEACALIADGAQQVLLVVADSRLPAVFQRYEDSTEQDFAWAWLLHAPKPGQPGHHLSLSWSALTPERAGHHDDENHQTTAGLDILRFFLRGDTELSRQANGRHWRWSRPCLSL